MRTVKEIDAEIESLQEERKKVGVDEFVDKNLKLIEKLENHGFKKSQGHYAAWERVEEFDGGYHGGGLNWYTVVEFQQDCTFSVYTVFESEGFDHEDEWDDILTAEGVIKTLKKIDLPNKYKWTGFSYAFEQPKVPDGVEVSTHYLENTELKYNL
jgi:hypothetical protein